MISGFSTINTWMEILHGLYTEKTEDLKSNKGNPTFPTDTANVIEL